ncbi:superfamily I DNA/RNA helicase [Sinorhizobium fredii]|uniref:UvrD-helicase domain-containing protein n=1 Tax=Rhizobium fredii TaxID=380 RepID=UPI003518B348
MSPITELSEQQKDIVGLPLGPLAVTACAGSGKTKTAVHRLAEMRSRTHDQRGVIALLSFSNVAVDTFEREYGALVADKNTIGSIAGVEIDTLDGFFVKNVIRPHGYLEMGCPRTPFLIEGKEPFLKNFTMWDKKREVSIPTADLSISLDEGDLVFSAGKWKKTAVPSGAAAAAVNKLGTVGAYTHDSGRHWAYRILKNHPFVLRALVKRYPHILVDEAQDIETVHEATLRLMAKAGMHLSLIGDANQGIYEFSGATGDFLASYDSEAGVTGKTLERNYRSVPDIVTVANKLSGRKDDPDRVTPSTFSGAYFVSIDDNDRETTFSTFRDMIALAEIKSNDAVVICRATGLVDAWTGTEETQGQGLVRAFSAAAIARDKLGRFDEAFAHVCVGTVGLLAPDHRDLLAKLRQGSKPEVKELRRLVWRFTKDDVSGLPSATLVADTEWHQALVTRAKALAALIEKNFGFQQAEKLGNRLKKTKLYNVPLIQTPDAEAIKAPAFKICTVHKVKGESIAAVLYIARKDDIEALLQGPTTETGRIGYVAVTRAQNLIVLGVPHDHIDAFRPRLIATGFSEHVPSAVAKGQL